LHTFLPKPQEIYLRLLSHRATLAVVLAGTLTGASMLRRTLKQPHHTNRSRIQAVSLAIATAALLFTSADAALTSCSLSGTYVTSASVDAPPSDQVLGSMTFTPPASCTAGNPGTVSVNGTILQRGSGVPILLAVASVPYLVDPDGAVTILLSHNDPITIQGQIGTLHNGIAHSIVFAASSDTNPDIRFSGVALKADATLLTGPEGRAGPAGPAGAPGPAGPAGAAGPTGP
jgi:hypothetical protein